MVKPALANALAVPAASPLRAVEFSTRTSMVPGEGSARGVAAELAVGQGEVLLACADELSRCSTRYQTRPLSKVSAARKTRAGSGRRRSELVIADPFVCDEWPF